MRYTVDQQRILDGIQGLVTTINHNTRDLTTLDHRCALQVDLCEGIVLLSQALTVLAKRAATFED